MDDGYPMDASPREDPSTLPDDVQRHPIDPRMTECGKDGHDPWRVARRTCCTALELHPQCYKCNGTGRAPLRPDRGFVEIVQVEPAVYKWQVPLGSILNWRSAPTEHEALWGSPEAALIDARQTYLGRGAGAETAAAIEAAFAAKDTE